MIKKNIYLNPKQMQLVQATQKEKVFIGGRGVGKSTVNGVETSLNVRYLPRSKGFILGLTYNQILTKFLPPVIDMWERIGLKEWISDKQPGHYIIGKQPPAYFERPWQPPRYYQNIISFSNGSCVELISFDRKNANRGGNYDWGVLDEAALVPKDRWDKEISVSVRGNIHRYNHHRHQNILYITSMPWLPSGMWVPDMAEDAKQYPSDFFYVEATAYDNIDVLGKDYLQRLKRKLPTLVYEVEVMNKRITRIPNCFYDEFDEQRHCYTNSFLYTDTEGGITTNDADYIPTMPIDISMDFGASFTCMVVAQEHGRDLRIINNFYSKRNHEEGSRNLITETIQKFAAYYGQHQSVVRVRGDRNGNNKQANSEYTFFEMVERELRKLGMKAELMVPRRLDALHRLKHFTINQLLAEANPRLPRIRINQNRCKELIISIQASPVTMEFRKDKSSEQQDIPQERATHLSDAFDYLVYHLYAGEVEQGSSSTDTQVFFV